MVIALYVVALLLTAVVLSAVAVTSFATTSRVDRAFAGLGAALAGYYAYHLIRVGDDGRTVIFYAALLLPIIAGGKLYHGFRHRDQIRAERAAARAAIRAADEWRSTRRW
ncbi:hypothetical protein [Micromonospora sp. NPDC051006]|uniref:hypothetical protein n=1 Tax=Micromonospora sp. NPDC051006 TaxID=3364283 RepID=UPI0037B63B45